MKLPKLGLNQGMLPTLAIGGIVGVILYTLLNKGGAPVSSSYARAANSFFAGETTYYPGSENYGADAQGFNYLRTNVVPNMTSFPPASIKNGINAIFRENLETG